MWIYYFNSLEHLFSFFKNPGVKHTVYQEMCLDPTSKSDPMPGDGCRSLSSQPQTRRICRAEQTSLVPQKPELQLTDREAGSSSLSRNHLTPECSLWVCSPGWCVQTVLTKLPMVTAQGGAWVESQVIIPAELKPLM